MTAIQIVAPQSIQETESLSLTLAKSALMPPELKGKQADILAVILTGAELGLAPMQSIRGIQIIKGKPSLSADLMAALCKKRPDICEHLTLKESSPTRVTYSTKRKGEVETTMSFTIEDAQRAGLASSDTYRKFPAAMLKARCLSAICRAVYPDLCLGLYDPDELCDVEPPLTIAPDPVRVEREVNAPPSIETKPSASGEMRTQIDAHQKRLETPSPTPPPKRIPIVDCDANGKPKLLVTFGPTKGKLIAELTANELAEAIGLGEERSAASPSAVWAAALNLCLADLRQEHGARIEKAIAAEQAAKETK